MSAHPAAPTPAFQDPETRKAAQAWIALVDAGSLRRELVTDTAVTDPPGVPPGEYFRIRYETECASGVIRETVLLVQEAGRGWRVARYLVEPARR